MKACGAPVELVQRLPEEGIIIGHRDFLTDSIYPTDKTVLVVLKPDRKPHSFAQVHVLQACSDPMLIGQQSQFCHNFVIPLWPQPDLVERRSDREGKLTNVSYVGRIEHLASDLRREEWAELLRTEMGIEWSVKGELTQWHDYSDVDVIVAIRRFQDDPELNYDTTDDVRMKPSSKLTNAWLAGVPAILGPEPSYQRLRKNSLDFIEVDSKETLFAALWCLKQNSDLQEQMIANGKLRAKQFSVDALQAQWKKLIFEYCLPVYELWRKADYRHQFFQHRQSRHVLPQLSLSPRPMQTLVADGGQS